MKGRPLGSQVLVKLHKTEKTQSGLVIDESGRPKPQMGTVVSSGPGRWQNGVFVKNEVVDGMVVLFHKFSGDEVPADLGGEDDEYLLMEEREILYAVEEPHGKPEHA